MLDIACEKKLGKELIAVKFVMGNEIAVILGPSGAGKTSVLNMIAGLLKPDSGYIRLGEKVFHEGNVDTPIQKRRVGYVVQNYALFPHLNVWDNLTFGASPPVKMEMAVDLLSLLGLKGLEGRRIQTLSGGQQQRVALGRALMAEPEILLLDEPFAALDNLMRSKLRLDLINIHRKYKLPVILVTHNLDEAFAMGDKIVVMNHGKVVQVGSKEEVFFAPVSPVVGRFVGIKNIFTGYVSKRCPGKKSLYIDAGEFLVETGLLPCREGAHVTFGIAPSEIMLFREDKELRKEWAQNVIRVIIAGQFQEESTVRLLLKLLNRKTEHQYDLEMLVPRHVFLRHNLSEGKEIKVVLKKQSIHVWQEENA